MTTIDHIQAAAPRAPTLLDRLHSAWRRRRRRRSSQPQSREVIQLLREIDRQGGAVEDSDPLLWSPEADLAIKHGLISSGGAMMVDHQLTVRGRKALADEAGRAQVEPRRTARRTKGTGS